MTNIYEHLIRRFGAEVNEAAEDFMTPRDVVHLATTLLLDPDDELFEANPGLIRTLYDQTCGTGGFLTDAMDHVDGLREQETRRHRARCPTARNWSRRPTRSRGRHAAAHAGYRPGP